MPSASQISNFVYIKQKKFLTADNFYSSHFFIKGTFKLLIWQLFAFYDGLINWLAIFSLNSCFIQYENDSFMTSIEISDDLFHCKYMPFALNDYHESD